MANNLRPRLFGFLTIAIVAGAGTQTFAMAADSQCAERRMSTPGVEQIAEIFIRDQASAQGHTTHGQNDQEGRPNPQISAIDLKRSWVKYVLPKVEWRDQAVMFFTIYNQKSPSADREVLNLPFDVYWCLAAGGDNVLLYDKRTAHYTGIASIDHERETVDLIDRWPDILSEFAGVAPVTFAASSGPAAGSKLVRFSRSDFQQLFVAAVILDTADFVHLLERSLPRESWTPELYIAVGRSLVYAGRYKAVPAPAADFIINGIRAAGRAGKQELVEESIPVMFAAVAMAHSFWLSKGRGDKAEIARKYVEEIAARYGSSPMQRLDAGDALRIGVFASAAGDWRTALLFLDQAIEKNPRDHRAYLFRSETVRKILPTMIANRDDAMAAASRAQKDVETALELMDAREREFAQRISDREKKHGVYWDRGWNAVEEDKEEYTELSAQRKLAMSLRDSFRLLLSELEGAAAPAQPRE
jgi:hypothetical protein